MSIFNQLFQIKGKHAEMVRKIKDMFGSECRNLDIFYISIVLGLSQNRHSKIDDETKVEPAKIDPEQMVRFNEDIQFLYRLVMLSDTNYCISAKKRTDKAFKDIEKSEKDELYFVETMLGGLEFFYEQVAKGAVSKNDIFSNCFDLVDSYNDRTEDITEDTLYQMFQE